MWFSKGHFDEDEATCVWGTEGRTGGPLPVPPPEPLLIVFDRTSSRSNSGEAIEARPREEHSPPDPDRLEVPRPDEVLQLAPADPLVERHLRHAQQRPRIPGRRIVRFRCRHSIRRHALHPDAINGVSVNSGAKL